MKKKLFLLVCIIILTIVAIFGQSNRATNEYGQLLWQYHQNVSIDDENQNTIIVTFVFTNGKSQIAITLRQELFNSYCDWFETSGMQLEKEEHVVFITANLSPYQSVVWKYKLTTKPIDNELIAERSALLILNENFEVQKEKIPEIRIVKN
ncbi:MAG: hypothetical protein LBU83_01520 [Bacteroidales bacterium]|jgi:hypothetical protein|nr:hypothetical protein [Bacteroidales bacterium]